MSRHIDPDEGQPVNLKEAKAQHIVITDREPGLPFSKGLMASQVMVQHGPNDAIRPFKPKGSGIRNDGIVALLMALARAQSHQQAAPKGIPTLWIPGVNVEVGP